MIECFIIMNNGAFPLCIYVFVTWKFYHDPEHVHYLLYRCLLIAGCFVRGKKTSLINYSAFMFRLVYFQFISDKPFNPTLKMMSHRVRYRNEYLYRDFALGSFKKLDGKCNMVGIFGKEWYTSSIALSYLSLSLSRLLHWNIIENKIAQD